MFSRATQARLFTERQSLGWGIFVLAVVVYAGPSLWMLRNYVQEPYDLAIYDQTLWLILNGESFNTIIASHIFGVHFSPVLILLAPLAAIPGGATPEIIAQSLIVASGVFPARKLAIAANRSPVWFMIAYAIHPAIIGGSWFGVRGWNLAVAPFMWALYLIWKRPTPGRVTMIGLLALLFREDLALWVGLAVLIVILAKRTNWRAMVTPAAVLILANGLVLFVVAPILSPTDSFFFTGPGESGGANLGSAVASFVVRSAFLLVPLAIGPSQLNWRLLAPLAVPIVGLIWKGGNAMTTHYHYDMMFVPLLLLVVALSPPTVFRIPLTLVASLSVLMTIGALRPFEPMLGPNPLKADRATTQYLDRVMDSVNGLDGTGEFSISAPPWLVPHLSERPNIFLFPSPVDQHQGTAVPGHFKQHAEFLCPQPNIVVVDTNEPLENWPSQLQSNYRLVDDLGQFQVWAALDFLGNKPCSAVWRSIE